MTSSSHIVEISTEDTGVRIQNANILTLYKKQLKTLFQLNYPWSVCTQYIGINNRKPPSDGSEWANGGSVRAGGGSLWASSGYVRANDGMC